jgi:hypothetical protein
MAIMNFDDIKKWIENIQISPKKRKEIEII